MVESSNFLRHKKNKKHSHFIKLKYAADYRIQRNYFYLILRTLGNVQPH